MTVGAVNIIVNRNEDARERSRLIIDKRREKEIARRLRMLENKKGLRILK